jgi:signal peptide peptidase SppA
MSDLIAVSSVQAELDFLKAKHDLEAKRAEFMNFDTSGMRPKIQMSGSVAIIPINGMITKRADVFELMAGATDVDDVARLADEAADMAAAGEISGVLLDIQSPGGYVIGLPEAAEAISALSDVTETVAFTDTLMASAAYDLAASANHIAAAGSSYVGSIGTIRRQMDYSQAMAQAGIKEHVFKSGTLKDMGNPAREPSEEEKQYFQEMVDAEGARFRESVLERRPGIPSDAMQGQVFKGSEALANKLIDAVVPSLDAAIAILNA